jgi:rhodanese-related sulfurtransferase
MKTCISLLALLATAITALAEEPKKSLPSSEPKNVTPAEAEKLISARKDLVVVDVRTGEEFAEGHIAGARNVSFLDDDFAAKLKQLEGKPVLVHCASGNRSSRAVKQMLGGGKFPEIFHLNDGFKAWMDAGKPVVKP